MLARDSSGKLYFENRRAIEESGEMAPRWQFVIIDPKRQTRTTCYVETKTCRINAYRQVTYRESEGVEDAPRATKMESASLGTSVIDSLSVEGTKETTSVAAGAYGNSQPMEITREIWHSPELDLNVLITKVDPRTGTTTRKIDIVSRGEPDAAYFAIPPDYTFLDNRPVGTR
jgi:hypothetical protein